LLDTGKSSWPELVGINGEVAAKIIESENPKVRVSIVEEGMMVTQEIRCDRVRVWVDKNGIVKDIPSIRWWARAIAVVLLEAGIFCWLLYSYYLINVKVYGCTCKVYLQDCTYHACMCTSSCYLNVNKIVFFFLFFFFFGCKSVFHSLNNESYIYICQ